MPIWSSIAFACSGSLSAIWRARRTATASATRCCCAPSCRSRSMRRRSVSVASTMRARDRAELVGLAADRVERLLQRGVELHVVQREADLARELGEREVVGFVERERALGARRTTMSPSSSPEFVTGAVRSTGSSRPVRIGGQPHLRPRRTGHAGVRDDRLLLGRERDAPRAAVGHRHRTLEPADAARPHLGDLEVHRRLERLGELEQQLVEGERARQAAAERAEHFVGCVALAVDAPRRELGEPFACRDPQQRGDSGREHREAEQRLLAAGRLVAEAEHDEEVRRRRPSATSPAKRDAVHEQPVDAHRELVGRAERDRERDEQRGWRSRSRRSARGHEISDVEHETRRPRSRRRPRLPTRPTAAAHALARCRRCGSGGRIRPAR